MSLSPLSVIRQNVCEILSFGTRVAGSESIGHRRTRDFLTQPFKIANSGWTTEFDSFSQGTVLGERTFHNIIAKLKAPSLIKSTKHDFKRSNTLLLGAHYDSKLFDFDFLGATDSVVSCAMLLYLASVLAHVPNRTSDVTIVFFDGEEAFGEWTQNDSLYGSRHLAQKWSETNELKDIRLFMLLDLIGCANPQFSNIYSNTRHFHLLLMRIEHELRSDRRLRTKKPFFIHQTGRYGPFDGEDDHTPFVLRGVPALPIVPYPFPSVWHTPKDTVDCLDWDTIFDLTEILQLFLVKFVTGGWSTSSKPKLED